MYSNNFKIYFVTWYKASILNELAKVNLSHQMEAQIDYNIVDQYYYPDSDLETIQEESSILDSEDDRRSISSRRSSSSTITSSKFDDNSQRSVRTQSSSTIRAPAMTEHHKAFPSSSSHRQYSYISYNGFDDFSHEAKGKSSIAISKLIYVL